MLEPAQSVQSLISQQVYVYVPKPNMLALHSVSAAHARESSVRLTSVHTPIKYECPLNAEEPLRSVIVKSARQHCGTCNGFIMYWFRGLRTALRKDFTD